MWRQGFFFFITGWVWAFFSGLGTGPVVAGTQVPGGLAGAGKARCACRCFGSGTRKTGRPEPWARVGALGAGGSLPRLIHTERRRLGQVPLSRQAVLGQSLAGSKTDFKMTAGRKHNVGVRTQRSLRSESPDGLVQEALFRVVSRRDPRGPVDLELKQRKKETMLPF